ncbi:3-oxoacyl-[acyl-carrier protein] reductase [Vulgatibacter incomptus]|uniref:3-oxoacyl-[acyl-carrier protein] reductase n=1 Tax=Vulgatibacter incomptus TaxID=1391653 RepID=A0A0K1PHF2_9BACT|nr:3-oxoacyl-[acyl-carrier protein] reductase [Vulgatibacter incomptus]
MLVTGGGSGIGRAVAIALARQGGLVVVAGRREERLAEVRDEHPECIRILPCDLESSAERSRLLRRASAMLGGLDGLVSCAGAAVHQLPGHIDEGALRRQLELNLVAPLRLGEQALSTLEPGGAVVFVASTLASRPVETSAVYSAAKAGLLAAMRSLALAGAPKRIRFNAVSPGVVDTEMVRTLRLAPGEVGPEPAERDARLEEQLAHLAALHPLGRLGGSEEVAEAIVHLLGAPWTTGTEHVIDGGLLLRE